MDEGPTHRRIGISGSRYSGIHSGGKEKQHRHMPSSCWRRSSVSHPYSSLGLVLSASHQLLASTRSSFERSESNDKPGPLRAAGASIARPCSFIRRTSITEVKSAQLNMACQVLLGCRQYCWAAIRRCIIRSVDHSSCSSYPANDEKLKPSLVRETVL